MNHIYEIEKVVHKKKLDNDLNQWCPLLDGRFWKNDTININVKLQAEDLDKDKWEEENQESWPHILQVNGLGL